MASASIQSHSETALEIAKVIAIGGGLVLSYKVIRSITDAFGLTQDEKDKILADALKDSNKDSTQIQDQKNPYVAFNPNYASAIVTAWKKKYPGQVWNTPKQAKFTQTEYKDMAVKIHNAKSGWLGDDNEDVLYSIFRAIQTQWQLSLLSSFFSTYFSQDLLLFLKSFLSPSEMGDILDMIRPYPQYFK